MGPTTTATPPPGPPLRPHCVSVCPLSPLLRSLCDGAGSSAARPCVSGGRRFVCQFSDPVPLCWCVPWRVRVANVCGACFVRVILEQAPRQFEEKSCAAAATHSRGSCSRQLHCEMMKVKERQSTELTAPFPAQLTCCSLRPNEAARLAVPPGPGRAKGGHSPDPQVH